MRSQIPSDNRSNPNAEDKRTTQTIQHARLLNAQHTSLTEIDVRTAEATARMISSGKILSSLLIYLTTPRPRVEADVPSKQPLTTGEKGFQPTERPLSATPKRRKEILSADKTTGLQPMLKHKRVVSQSEDDVDGLMATESTAIRESSAPEDTSAVGENVPKEPAAAIKPSKRAKAAKKNNRSGKQAHNQRNKMGATFTPSAYPTQRPPRKKSAKQAILARESSEAKELAPEKCDLEKTSVTRSQPEWSADEETTLEQRSIPEKSLQISHKSPESTQEEHEESEGQTVEEVVDSEKIGTDVGFPSSENIHDRAAPDSPLEEYKEFDAHTAEEGFDSEHSVTDVGSFSSNLVHDCASPRSAFEEYQESDAYAAEAFSRLGQAVTDVGSSSSDCYHTITTTRKLISSSLPTKPIHDHGGGVQGLLWAYAVNPRVDKILEEAGVWLWQKPETHFCDQPLMRTKIFGRPVLAPVLISQQRTGDYEPNIEFDGNTVHIVPHKQCWEDIRSDESHPDFLVPWKLAEYQACEAAGYQVWRHDRDLLECRMPNCTALVSDHHYSTIVCLGCGPKSIVRYCSSQHQLEDIEGHWNVCGSWRVLLRRVIDHTTAPSKFARMCPAIKQRHGSRNAALHRQIHHCALTYGHYTLFDPNSNRSETLYFSKQDPKWPIMDRRIERLLNITFLDSWNHCILGYLYRLLRELLRSQGKWTTSTERLLKLQFEAEFSHYKVNLFWHNSEAPCECEWTGKILPRHDHLSTCSDYNPVACNHGPVWRQNFIEATVTGYEERFWILRAWRQQHPTQNNWRLRAAGYGFGNMIPDEGCYELGPGWTGWGGERDNICKDQWNRGEGSMRSA